MSELRNIQVAADAVRVGDLLGRPGRPVTAVDVKVKWVYATVEGRKNPVELRRDTEVEVGRVVLTDAEQAEADAAEAAAKAAKKLASKLEWLDFKERGARDALKAAQDKMTASMAADYAVGYSEIRDLVAAQTTFAVWTRVTRVAHYQSRQAATFMPDLGVWTVGDLADIPGRLEAFEDVKEELREELIRAGRSSQSTSVMSNAVDAVALDAKAAFLSRW